MTTPRTALGPGWSPGRGTVRLLRVAVLGGSSLVLAVAAHLVGGGGLPTPGPLVVSALLVGLVAVTVTGRRVRWAPLMVLLAAEQLLLHVVFTASTASSGVSASCAPMTGGHHAGLGAGCLSTPATIDGAVDGAMAMPGWGMWAGHAAAVVATAWLLARGEAWLWRTADRIVAAATAAPTRRRRPAGVTLTSPTAAPVASGGYAPADPRGPPALISR